MCKQQASLKRHGDCARAPRGADRRASERRTHRARRDRASRAALAPPLSSPAPSPPPSPPPSLSPCACHHCVHVIPSCMPHCVRVCARASRMRDACMLSVTVSFHRMPFQRTCHSVPGPGYRPVPLYWGSMDTFEIMYTQMHLRYMYWNILGASRAPHCIHMRYN